MLIDTHCHLDFDRFADDIEAVIERAITNDVTRIIVPAIDLQNCPAVLALADRFEGVFAAVGVHPNSTANWQDSYIGVLRDLARHPKVVAIGEIGIDYYWDKSPKEIQHRALRLQLELACELGLPVILHNREARDSDASSHDILRLLRESPLAEVERPGVLHSFSADSAIAEEALALGYYLGFTGPLTFKKADELRRVVAQVPLDRLLVETDAPFLTPSPHRGKRNEPAYVRYVAERMAVIKGIDDAALFEATTQNAVDLFGDKLR